MSEQESEVFKIQERCKTDLEFLYKELCGYDRWNHKLHGDYEGIKKDGEFIEPPGIVNFLKNSGSRKLILVPRNHLKSTVVTIVWSIQQILINPNIRICINNAKYDTAREFVQTIQSFLDTNSKLEQVFGKFRSPRLQWNRDSFTIAHRTLNRAQPTVMAASIDSILNGKHFDLIINDDLVEPNNVRTKDQIQKVIDFHKDCFNQIDKGGIIVIKLSESESFIFKILVIVLLLINSPDTSISSAITEFTIIESLNVALPSITISFVTFIDENKPLGIDIFFY